MLKIRLGAVEHRRENTAGSTRERRDPVLRIGAIVSPYGKMVSLWVVHGSGQTMVNAVSVVVN